jgi:amino-acid N-acetyltransferase
VVIRKARIKDIKEAHRLINEMAKKNEMLPRSLNELYENIRDIFLATGDGGIMGTCSIHILWEDLAEIRSLAVKKEHQRTGIGRALIKRCMKEAKALGIKRVFALTYQPEFFRTSGFRDVDKSELPQKIWGDCLRCAKFPECDEHAVIKEL